MRRAVLITLLALTGCATTGHDTQACDRHPLTSPEGWTVYVCPHPFALMGLTSGESMPAIGQIPSGYGAGASWRHAFTDQATKEIFIQDGYQYLVEHELQHARGMVHP